jgi:hypothetical protein
MITNADRSGSVRVEIGKDRRTEQQDETRSGSVSDRAPQDEKRHFGRRQKIAEVNGERVLVDA